MEIDSGAECTTIPWSYFNQNLSSACELRPTSVTLYQYDTSPLVVKGECHASVQVNEQVIAATFIVVDAKAQYPLFGRNWMSLLGINVSFLILQATQVHSTVERPSTHNSLLAEYADVFKEKLGVLKEIEAVITVGEHATLKFHRHCPVSFAIKEKVEQALQAQVDKSELIPVERSEWVAPIVVVLCAQA